jgi:hypothetical protein
MVFIQVQPLEVVVVEVLLRLVEHMLLQQQEVVVLVLPLQYLVQALFMLAAAEQVV